MIDEEALRSSFEEDKGGSGCVVLADALRTQGRHLEATDICIAGLSVNPHNHHARLLLARLFADRGYHDFAAREVRELLTFFPESTALKKLSSTLVPEAAMPAAVTSGSVDTLAEAEIDFSDLEKIEAEKNERPQ